VGVFDGENIHPNSAMPKRNATININNISSKNDILAIILLLFKKS